MLEHRDLTARIIGLAIEVHRRPGPGLLEAVCAGCLAFALEQAGIPLPRQVGVPVFYQRMQIQAVAALPPVHEARLLSYPRMSGLPVGLLMNSMRCAGLTA